MPRTETVNAPLHRATGYRLDPGDAGATPSQRTRGIPFSCYDEVKRAIVAEVMPRTMTGPLPDEAPGQIAILRLDTDWYVSTKHELGNAL